MGKNTVKNLYDVRSFGDAAITAKHFKTTTGKTFDSAGILLPRQLEHISTTIYQQRFANLSFLSGGGITINNEGGAADTITKIKQTINGDFATAGNTSNTDGKISLSAQSASIQVTGKKAESSWSVDELEQAQMANVNLVSNLIAAHNTKYNQAIDEIGYIGNTFNEGLLNYSGFDIEAATGVFSGLTAQQMYDNIKDLVNAQRTVVSLDEVFSCNKLACSPGIFTRLSTTILNTAAGAMSVLAAIKLNLNIDFVITFRATALKSITAYTNSDLAMVMRIPKQLTLSNIYQLGFDSYVESMFRVGGLDVIENGAGYILTGVE